MKLSKYVTMVQMKNGDWIVHSGLTGAVLKVKKENKEEFDLLCAGKITSLTDDPIEECAYSHVVEGFRKALILLDDGVDEVRFLENRFFKARHLSNAPFGVTIAPTMQCNLACPYCYNPKKTTVSMNETTIKNVKSFIERKLLNRPEHARKMHIIWVGGEPLFDFKVFKKIATEIDYLADKHKATYGSMLITNGTLVTDDMALSLTKKPFNIRNLQITLDGPQEIHDKSRFYKDGRGTFDVICDGIKIFSKYMNVNIRVNIDGKITTKHMETFINQIFERGILEDPKGSVVFYLGRLHCVPGGTEGGCRISADDLEYISMEDYANLELECARMARRMKFPMHIIDHRLPTPLPCGVASENSFTIDSEGSLGRCWHSMGDSDDNVGSVNKKIDLSNSNYRKWLDYNPYLDEECVNCRILPLCPGGCPSFRVADGFDTEQDKLEKCRAGRYDLEKRLLFTYNGE